MPVSSTRRTYRDSKVAHWLHVNSQVDDTDNHSISEPPRDTDANPNLSYPTDSLATRTFRNLTQHERSLKAAYGEGQWSENATFVEHNQPFATCGGLSDPTWPAARLRRGFCHRIVAKPIRCVLIRSLRRNAVSDGDT